MKFFYVLLIASLIGLMCFSFYYTNIHKGTLKYTVNENLADGSLYLYNEYGDIFYKTSLQGVYMPFAGKKITLPNHVFIKTGDSRGYILFPNTSSISLATSTEIEITFEPTKISVMQLRGSTYHRVLKVGLGNTYEVVTPNTLAKVLGTKFAIIYSPILKKTSVAVTEHNVEVTQIKEDGTILKAPVVVSNGSLAEIQSSIIASKKDEMTSTSFDKVTITTIDENKEASIFIDENKEIDIAYDKVSLLSKKEFLEKLIDSLRQDKEATTATIINEISQSPSVKESRTETINRVLKSSSTTTIKVTQRTSFEETQKPQNIASSTKLSTTATTESSQKLLKTDEGGNSTSGGTVLRNIPITAEELTPIDETFIDAFYIVYEKYFLVDDPSSYCAKIGVISTEDIMKNLLFVTNKAGVFLPGQGELTTFAEDLVNACKDGSMQAKSTAFKTRFDVAYPY